MCALIVHCHSLDQQQHNSCVHALLWDGRWRSQLLPSASCAPTETAIDPPPPLPPLPPPDQIIVPIIDEFPQGFASILLLGNDTTPITYTAFQWSLRKCLAGWLAGVLHSTCVVHLARCCLSVWKRAAKAHISPAWAIAGTQPGCRLLPRAASCTLPLAMPLHTPAQHLNISSPPHSP